MKKRRRSPYGRPDIQDNRISGFLLEDLSWSKTICISTGCIILTLILFLPCVDAIELSGGTYNIDAVAFANGGGPTVSATRTIVMSIIGEGLIPLSTFSSGQYSLQAGQVQLIYGVEEALEEDTDWLIGEITARTDVLGDVIDEKTWQRDNDPYIYWGVTVEPAALIDGYSIAVDAQPDGEIDTYAPHYQFPEAGIANGRHVIYVVPFYSAGIPETESTRSFEIWIDRLGPYVDQIVPTSGTMVSDNRIQLSCRVSDADSGVDVTSVTMELNGRRVAATLNAESGLFASSGEESVADGKNTVVVSLKDNTGNTASQAWEFIADSQPPLGKFTINGGAEITHSAYVSLHLDAWDTTSSVTTVYISNDGIFDTELNHPFAYQTVITQWLVTEPDIDGAKTVYVRFGDAARNISGVYSDQIQLHRLTPDTRITSGPAAATQETQAAFTYESTKQNSQFSTRIDSEAWSKWGTGRDASYSNLAEGNHYFFVKSGYDLNGDGSISIDEEDPTPAQWIWSVGDDVTERQMEEQILFWKR